MQTRGRVGAAGGLAGGVAFNAVEFISVAPVAGGIDRMTGVNAGRRGEGGDADAGIAGVIDVVRRAGHRGRSGVRMTAAAAARHIGSISHMIGVAAVDRRRRVADGAVSRGNTPDRRLHGSPTTVVVTGGGGAAAEGAAGVVGQAGAVGEAVE